MSTPLKRQKRRDAIDRGLEAAIEKLEDALAEYDGYRWAKPERLDIVEAAIASLKSLERA